MTPGTLLTLTIDKPAAGGRMLARHDGTVILVSGAIPGEVVEARVEKVQRGTVWAAVERVVEASPDRVPPFCDGACGGTVYAHVRYERQVVLKGEIIADAFTRIGRLDLPAPLVVTPSPVDGYRMRARLHVRRGRIGFFREGTHELCAPGPTRQLLSSTLDVLARLETVVRELPRAGVTGIELSENRDGSERACHLDLAPGGDPSRLPAATTLIGLTGVSAAPAGARRAPDLWGSAVVADTLAVPGREGVSVRLERHARTFFQANRHLLDELVAAVAARVPDGPVVDLYAGVGLFALTLAAAGRGPVIAVESDMAAAADLRRNAGGADGRIAVRHLPVERFSTERTEVPAGATVLVDPPRTGMSREALDAVLRLRAPRLVYVSCDVATLARDARRLVDDGYRLETAEGFDLFPNTAHVETIVTFERPA